MLQKAYILIYATLYHNVPKKSNEIGIFRKFSQKFQVKKQKTILFLKESSDRKEKYRIGGKKRQKNGRFGGLTETAADIIGGTRVMRCGENCIGCIKFHHFAEQEKGGFI